MATEPHCEKCSGPLPCREHPAPPGLTIVGGNEYEPHAIPFANFKKHFSQSHPEETSANSSDADAQSAGAIHKNRSPRDRAVAAAAGGLSGSRPQDLQQDAVHGALSVPLKVAQASERLAAASNVVELPVFTTVDIPPENILAQAARDNDSLRFTTLMILAETEDGQSCTYRSTADVPQLLWMLEAYKTEIMNASVYPYDDE